MLVIEDADELDELDLGAASAPPPPRATTAGFAASRPNVRMGFGFGAAGQPESLSLSEARRARAQKRGATPASEFAAARALLALLERHVHVCKQRNLHP